MKQPDTTAPAFHTTPLEPKISIISLQCRICYENDKNEPLIAPCNCKGTVAFVHQSCLEKWFAESNTTVCELCHVVFRTERLPKYTPRQSIWRWVRNHRAPVGIARGVRSDIIACTVITPVAIIITYACLYSSDYYNDKKFALLPAARWTSVSLLLMIGIMLIGYYLWVYSVIRMHSRMWYNWWQRDCVVRYVPPNTAEVCCQSSTEVVNSDNTASTTLMLEVTPSLNNENETEDVNQPEVGSDSGEITSADSEEKAEDEVFVLDTPEEEISDDSKAKEKNDDIS